MYLCRKFHNIMKLYIRERAKEAGISLIDIFNELGLKSYPSFLRTIDNGDNVKLKQLQVIAEKLNCTIDDLVSSPSAPKPSAIACPYCGKVIILKAEKDGTAR